MDPKPGDKRSAPQHGRTALWMMLLGSPVIWLVSLQVCYSLVGYACLWQTRWPLLLASLAGVLLALGNATWAHGRVRALDREAVTDTQVKRARFMAQAGMWLSLLFALLMTLQGVAVLLLDPCRL